MNLLDLGDKRVLITGGVGAIGRVIVRELAAHGATVAVNDIVDEAAARLALSDQETLPAGVSYHRFDTRQEDAVERLFDDVTQAVGLPNVVCCHAGMTEVFPIHQYPIESFDTLMNLNVRSAFLVARAASRRWIEQNIRGHLVFTTSWVQDVPWPEIAPYNASKAALKSLMRGFARELAPHGIRANAVAPGIVAVGLAKRQWDIDPAYRARAAKAIPLGEMQPPESVAHAFLFLCSGMADYMTGAVLLVDGGTSLYPMD